MRERPFRAKVVGPAFERGGHSFNIDLYPGGFREDGKASVGAYLRYKGARPCLELRLRLSVVDQRGGPDVAWRSGLALLGARARLDQGVVTNWGSARLVPRVWLAAGNGHPGLVVDDCVRFRVDARQGRMLGSSGRWRRSRGRAAARRPTHTDTSAMNAFV